MVTETRCWEQWVIVYHCGCYIRVKHTGIQRAMVTGLCPHWPAVVQRAPKSNQYLLNQLFHNHWACINLLCGPRGGTPSQYVLLCLGLWTRIIKVTDRGLTCTKKVLKRYLEKVIVGRSIRVFHALSALNYKIYEIIMSNLAIQFRKQYIINT